MCLDVLFCFIHHPISILPHDYFLCSHSHALEKKKFKHNSQKPFLASWLLPNPLSIFNLLHLANVQFQLEIITGYIYRGSIPVPSWTVSISKISKHEMNSSFRIAQQSINCCSLCFCVYSHLEELNFSVWDIEHVAAAELWPTLTFMRRKSHSKMSIASGKFSCTEQNCLTLCYYIAIISRQKINQLKKSHCRKNYSF